MSSKKKGSREDFKQEDILQAVVIADSFNVRFAPITQDKPRALLPLVNVPLLDYTLEFLCTSGIQEIIIFCKNHSDQIRRHIENCKWSGDSSPVDITVLSSKDSLSLGDALREIDGHSLIKSDFVLVSGDLVANLKLANLISEHKLRRVKEKTAVMTMLYKSAPPGHASRCREEEVILAIKRENDRLLHYQKVGSSKKFDFPLTIFQEHKDVQLRYDLIDCQVAICSPQVPMLFTDNFDHETCDDFIKDILINEEVMGNTIHIRVVEDEYAFRISNLQTYDAVSKDVMNRWSYPLVPDCNITGNGDDKYNHSIHNTYFNRDITLARGCVVQENVVVGKGSSVGSNTSISHSVIGKNCTIGENVKLEGAYIWDNVRIDDGCTVRTALLADHVHVKSRVTISPGCVLASGVVVGPDIKLPEGLLLSAKPPPPDEFAEEGSSDDTLADSSVVGSEGVAYVYQPAVDSDEELDDVVQDMWGLNIQSEEEDVSSIDSESGDDESPTDSPPPDDTKLFFDEVIGTMERALEENIGTENMILEINSLKHGYNIQIREVNVLVTKAIMELPLRSKPDMEPTEYLNTFKNLMKTLLPLFKNYIKSAESQRDCLSAMEDLSITNRTVGTVLIKVLPMLYNVDIISEEVLLYWHQNISNPEDTEQRKKLRKQVQSFITWLEEAEEESSEEEEED